jgi:hypothetical protein
MSISSKYFKHIDLLSTSLIGGIFNNPPTSTGNFKLVNESPSASLLLEDEGTTGLRIIQSGDGDLRIEHTSASTGNILITNTKGSNNSSLTITSELAIFSDSIRIGTTTNTTSGNIRWNGTNFQGYDGTAWVNFDILVSGTTSGQIPIWNGTDYIPSSNISINDSNRAIVGNGGSIIFDSSTSVYSFNPISGTASIITPSGSLTIDPNNDILSIGGSGQGVVQLGGTDFSGTPSNGMIKYDAPHVEVYTQSQWRRVNFSNTLTLTDAGTVNWNTANGNVARVTLAGNRLFATPTNLTVGEYMLFVVQDSTGSRTLDLANSSIVRWGIGEYPVLSTLPNSIDIIQFYYDGTNLFITNFKKGMTN